MKASITASGSTFHQNKWPALTRQRYHGRRDQAPQACPRSGRSLRRPLRVGRADGPSAGSGWPSASTRSAPSASPILEPGIRDSERWPSESARPRAASSARRPGPRLWGATVGPGLPAWRCRAPGGPGPAHASHGERNPLAPASGCHTAPSPVSPGRDSAGVGPGARGQSRRRRGLTQAECSCRREFRKLRGCCSITAK